MPFTISQSLLFYFHVAMLMLFLFFQVRWQKLLEEVDNSHSTAFALPWYHKVCYLLKWLAVSSITSFPTTFVLWNHLPAPAVPREFNLLYFKAHSWKDIRERMRFWYDKVCIFVVAECLLYYWVSAISLNAQSLNRVLPVTVDRTWKVTEEEWLLLIAEKRC